MTRTFEMRMPLAVPDRSGRNWQYGYVRMDVLQIDPERTVRLYGPHSNDIVHEDKHFEPIARNAMLHTLQDVMIEGRSKVDGADAHAAAALNAARIEGNLKDWRVDLTDTDEGGGMREDARHLVSVEDLLLIRGVGPARTLQFAYQAHPDGQRHDLRPLSKIAHQPGFTALRLHRHAMVDRSEYDTIFAHIADPDHSYYRTPQIDLGSLDIPDVHALALEGLAHRACLSFIGMPFASVGMDKLIALQGIRRLLFEREGIDPYTRPKHSVFRAFDPVDATGLGESIAAVVSTMDAALPKGREYEHAYLTAQAERFPEIMRATGHADLAEFSL